MPIICIIRPTHPYYLKQLTKTQLKARRAKVRRCYTRYMKLHDKMVGILNKYETSDPHKMGITADHIWTNRLDTCSTEINNINHILEGRPWLTE